LQDAQACLGRQRLAAGHHALGGVHRRAPAASSKQQAAPAMSAACVLQLLAGMVASASGAGHHSVELPVQPASLFHQQQSYGLISTCYCRCSIRLTYSAACALQSSDAASLPSIITAVLQLAILFILSATHKC
jgi:hypothetical protein